VPLVSVYQSDEREDEYRTVMTAVRDAVQEYRVGQRIPNCILMDIESAIIRATKDVVLLLSLWPVDVLSNST